MWRDLRLDGSSEWVAESLRNKSLVCVTDGSYNKKEARDVCSAGWTMTCRQSGRKISGTLVEVSPSADSYRGEMLGMLAIRLFLLAVEEYYGVITVDNKICCDNKGALFTFEKKSKRVPSGKANTDILRVLRTINSRTKSNFVQRHVKAHQDEVKKWRMLTFEEKLNFNCDKLAKEAISNHLQYELEKEVERMTNEITDAPLAIN